MRKDIPTLWVKVTLPLSDLEDREVARGTSPKGHARSHYHTVFWDIPYDCEVCTLSKSSQELACQIKESIDKRLSY